MGLPGESLGEVQGVVSELILRNGHLTSFGDVIGVWMEWGGEMR